MAKTGSPWYRKGKDSWYVWHAGRPVFLAKGRGNKAEAFARFSALLNDPDGELKEAQFTVADVVQEFDKSAAERVTPRTLTAYWCILKPFTAAFGTLSPTELTPPQVLNTDTVIGAHGRKTTARALSEIRMARSRVDRRPHRHH